MAPFDFLSNFGFSSGNFLYGGGSILIIIFIAIMVFWIRRRRADRGSWLAWGEEKEEGLRPYAGSERQIQSFFTALAQRARKFGIMEKLQEKLASKFKGASEAVRAVEASSKASEDEMQAEEASAAIEGRSIGIEAALKGIARALILYDYNKKTNSSNEAKEMSEIEILTANIQELADSDQIDERAADYLKGFVARLVLALQNDLKTEEQKKALMESLVPEVEKAVEVMGESINGARIKIKSFQSRRKKTKKYSGEELKDFEQSLKEEEKALEEMNQDKEAEPTVWVELRRELDMKWEQLKNAKAIGRQLEATYAFMKKVGKEMRRLLKYVLSNQKDINKFDKALEDRKKQIVRRLERLGQAFGSIQKVQDIFNNGSINEAALELSSSLRSYFKILAETQQEDLEFNIIARNIAIKEYAISQQMGAFQQLSDSMVQSEMAADAGIEAITELLSGDVGDSSKKDIAGIIDTLKNSIKILNYEHDIVSFMKNLAQTLQKNSRDLIDDLRILIDKGKELLARVRQEEIVISSRLGLAVSKIVQKKIEIGSMTIQQSKAFQQQFYQSNALAAARYNQAMTREALAPAA